LCRTQTALEETVNIRVVEAVGESSLPRGFGASAGGGGFVGLPWLVQPLGQKEWLREHWETACRIFSRTDSVGFAFLGFGGSRGCKSRAVVHVSDHNES
jgi:hypothetical protein